MTKIVEVAKMTKVAKVIEIAEVAKVAEIAKVAKMAKLTKIIRDLERENEKKTVKETDQSESLFHRENRLNLKKYYMIRSLKC